jgi:CyaY protein
MIGGSRKLPNSVNLKKMDEQEFSARADEALTRLFHALSKAAERHDFEADFNSGALSVEFEDPPARFVVSPNSPVRQVWVSAHSKSFKLDWEPGRNAFILRDTGETLDQLLAGAVSQQLGEQVSL